MGVYDSYMAVELSAEHLSDVKTRMHEALNKGFRDWSEDEERMLKQMVSLCEDIIGMYASMKRKGIKHVDDLTDEEYDKLVLDSE